MSRYAERCFSLLVTGGTVLGCLWLGIRFLLPWTAPFLLAFALAAAVEGAVRTLIARGMRRPLAAALAALLVLGALTALGTLLFSRGIAALEQLAAEAPGLLATLGRTLGVLEGRLLALAQGEAGSETLKSALDALNRSLYSVPAAVFEWLLDTLRGMAQSSPDALLFVVTALLGSWLISASYPRVTAFLAAQLPEPVLHRVRELTGELQQSFGGWLRAQALLMGLTFFELLLFFLLLGVPSPLLTAAVTALVDAMPVFGVGTVLLPWAVLALLQENSRLALGLVGAWAVCNIVRNIFQAKLLGDQIGLDPLAALLSIYVGWRVGGFWGALLLPVLLSAAQQLNDRGVIRLWKTV